MRPFVIFLAFSLLLTLVPDAAASPCTAAPDCVSYALRTVQDTVEDARALLDCTTEAFGCVPQPARDVLTCLVYDYGCASVHALVAAAQDRVCETIGCGG